MTIQHISGWFAELEHPYKRELLAVRDVILQANAEMEVFLHRNTAHFSYRPFRSLYFAAIDPHELSYARLVIGFYNGHMLPHRYDGLLEGHSHNRRVIRFFSLDDVRRKQAQLHTVVNDWVALIPAG